MKLVAARTLLFLALLASATQAGEKKGLLPHLS